MPTGSSSFLRNKVNQIVYVKDVATGKYAFDAGFQALIYDRAGGDGLHIYTDASGDLIFRDQTAGEQQCVTGVFLLSSGNRLSFFINGCEGDALEALFSFDIHNRMAEL